MRKRYRTLWAILILLLMATSLMGQNIKVSGIGNSADGIYIEDGTSNSHTKWKHSDNNGYYLSYWGCGGPTYWAISTSIYDGGDCPQGSSADDSSSPVGIHWEKGGEATWHGAPTISVVWAGMGVEGQSNYIPSGDTTPATADDTDFGSAGANVGTVDHTFTIANYNTSSLALGGDPKVAITGANAGDFTVTAQPSSPLAQDATTTFTVQFAPTATGTRSATVSIANDCIYENPTYTFTIQGLGTSTSTISGNAGVAGATMTYNDGGVKTATADGSGDYSFAVSWDWSGTVTPSKTGYTFSPVNRSYSNVQTNQSNQDYTATGTSSAPTATTNAASGTSTSGTTLNGTVNANNASTTVTFEYGLDTSYGTTVTADQSPVTGSSNTSVNKAVTGLTANTTYHYRVKGVNSQGTTNGADLTFTTSAAVPTATTDAASAVGTDGATLNGTVNANNASTTVT
ncbi:choice-of-anchor D domain-containing protein, partial [bacterium]|nr:choice-of-anchor D domain-containing protein [bacterium]